MFKTAKTLNSSVKTTAGKKKDKEIIELPGAEQLAHLDAVIKAATAAKDAIENGLREVVLDKFMDQIGDTGKKPESFYGVEGFAEVNLQMRKRGTNSALNADEQELLSNKGVAFKREVITPQLFAINPAYATDAKLLERVEKALAKIVPEDFIVMQEEKFKMVVDDDCLEAAFKSGDREVIEIATCLAFKPKLTEMRSGDIAKTVAEILDAAAEAPAPEEKPAPAAKPARKTKA